MGRGAGRIQDSPLHSIAGLTQVKFIIVADHRNFGRWRLLRRSAPRTDHPRRPAVLAPEATVAGQRRYGADRPAHPVGERDQPVRTESKSGRGAGPLGLRDEDPVHAFRHLHAAARPTRDRLAAMGDGHLGGFLRREGRVVDFGDGRWWSCPDRTERRLARHRPPGGLWLRLES